ncbi:MAG TPA: hypothetical protein VGN80_13200 [Devosiaceae bacterium]|nr:hypothetical protein [Devosiaceae bacterium]
MVLLAEFFDQGLDALQRRGDTAGSSGFYPHQRRHFRELVPHTMMEFEEECVLLLGRLLDCHLQFPSLLLRRRKQIDLRKNESEGRCGGH